MAILYSKFLLEEKKQFSYEMLRMKIQYREFMYFGFTVMVPPMMLFKSPFTHAAIAYVISIVIFLYDPVVKGIRKAINYT
ncbi:MAG TPA: hypothetical protein DCS87_11470 [Rheinheimera sp.]|nr:hypothetical protein [Rheinheimera sp.]